MARDWDPSLHWVRAQDQVKDLDEGFLLLEDLALTSPWTSCTSLSKWDLKEKEGRKEGKERKNQTKKERIKERKKDEEITCKNMSS